MRDLPFATTLPPEKQFHFGHNNNRIHDDPAAAAADLQQDFPEPVDPWHPILSLIPTGEAPDRYRYIVRANHSGMPSETTPENWLRARELGREVFIELIWDRTVPDPKPAAT